MRFEWDTNKAQSNLKKHGVSFADAKRMLIGDPYRQEFFQRVKGEDRWKVLGRIGEQVLVVVYAENEEEAVIRIITARKATNDEQKTYFRRTR